MSPLVRGNWVEAESAGNIVKPPIAIYCELDLSVRTNIEHEAALAPALPLGQDLAVTASRTTRIDPGFDGHGVRKSEIGSIGNLDEGGCSVEIYCLPDFARRESSAALQHTVIAAHAVERVAFAALPTDQPG